MREQPSPVDPDSRLEPQLVDLSILISANPNREIIRLKAAKRNDFLALLRLQA